MELPEVRELAEALRTGESVFAVLVAGEDDAVREAATALLRESIERTRSSVATVRVDAGRPKTDAWDRLLAEAQAVPLFGERVLFVVENIGSGSEVPDGLSSVLQSRPEHLRLVLLGSEKTRSGALARAVAKVGRIVLAQPPKDREAHRWIQSMAREVGLQLDPGAQAALADLVGADRAALEGVLRTLRDLAGPDARISERDLPGMVQRTRKAAPWDLTDALSSRNLPVALKVAWREMEDSRDNRGEAIRLFHLIARHLRRIRMAQDLVRRQVPADEAMKAVDVRLPFQWDALRKAASQYSAEELESFLRRSSSWETRMKRASASPEALVTALLTEILLPGNSRPGPEPMQRHPSGNRGSMGPRRAG